MTLDKRLEELTPESEVRAMRDKVYGAPSKNKNWEFAKIHWMKPSEIKWLKEQLEKRRANGMLC